MLPESKILGEALLRAPKKTAQLLQPKEKKAYFKISGSH